MTLHIFNPEHDLALASGLANFTAPHAGRQLRHDLGFLPVLWAGEDDLVLVDNIEAAERGLRQLRLRVRLRQTPGLVTLDSRFSNGKLPVSRNITHVEPWGWDSALCAQLQRHLPSLDFLPDEAQLQAIRALSHRRTAARLLSRLRLEGTVGEATECRTIDEVEAYVVQHPRTVLKAPWSSSGRGIRFVDSVSSPTVAGWLRNVLKAQGSVMAEPYYNKVKDFGMEFELRQGRIYYLGLSLFHTANGAYTGNILATEAAKRELMAAYLPLELLDSVKHKIESIVPDEPALQSLTLLFGIDMMVVANSQTSNFMLHPCVEINLRRTMGHVALALTRLVNPDDDDDIRKVMRIAYDNNRYTLKINNL